MRDIGEARTAFATLTELLSRFPTSPYAADARKRLVSLRNQLARAEIHVANYYFSRSAYLAAANRGQYVVENFQQSPAASIIIIQIPSIPQPFAILRSFIASR